MSDTLVLDGEELDLEALASADLGEFNDKFANEALPVGEYLWQVEGMELGKTSFDSKDHGKPLPMITMKLKVVSVLSTVDPNVDADDIVGRIHTEGRVIWQKENIAEVLTILKSAGIYEAGVLTDTFNAAVGQFLRAPLRQGRKPEWRQLDNRKGMVKPYSEG